MLTAFVSVMMVKAHGCIVAFLGNYALYHVYLNSVVVIHYCTDHGSVVQLMQSA